jgi:hypothetical protein
LLIRKQLNSSILFCMIADLGGKILIFLMKEGLGCGFMVSLFRLGIMSFVVDLTATLGRLLKIDDVTLR